MWQARRTGDDQGPFSFVRTKARNFEGIDIETPLFLKG